MVELGFIRNDLCSICADLPLSQITTAMIMGLDSQIHPPSNVFSISNLEADNNSSDKTRDKGFIVFCWTVAPLLMSHQYLRTLPAAAVEEAVGKFLTSKQIEKQVTRIAMSKLLRI